MSETGETTASIRKREDLRALPGVLHALGEGARLRWDPKIERAVVEKTNGDDWSLPAGRTISRATLRRLIADGVVYSAEPYIYRASPSFRLTQE